MKYKILQLFNTLSANSSKIRPKIPFLSIYNFLKQLFKSLLKTIRKNIENRIGTYSIVKFHVEYEFGISFSKFHLWVTVYPILTLRKLKLVRDSFFSICILMAT